MESKIEKAKQVFRKMLVDEYGIKSADQFFSTEGEAMAEINADNGQLSVGYYTESSKKK